MNKKEQYIPALHFHWLTPIYDPLLKWGMREDVIKRRLIDRAGIQPGDRVLDLGCGTGTLTLMIQRAQPGAEVVGLDGDPRVLAIAREKARRAGMQITWDEGLADSLPYPAGSFDRVVSSLMIHHLAHEVKRGAMQEVLRVLRPGGTFHVLDFGRPHSLAMRLASLLVSLLEPVRENLDGKLITILEEAGFNSVSEGERFATIVGPLSLYRAAKPG